MLSQASSMEVKWLPLSPPVSTVTMADITERSLGSRLCVEPRSCVVFICSHNPLKCTLISPLFHRQGLWGAVCPGQHRLAAAGRTGLRGPGSHSCPGLWPGHQAAHLTRGEGTGVLISLFQAQDRCSSIGCLTG